MGNREYALAFGREDVKRESTRFAHDVERETRGFAGGLAQLVGLSAAVLAAQQVGQQAERMIHGH